MAEEEQWKRVLLTMQDQVFFDIMRTYLGPVKTPFNKHSLIEDLAAFLRREVIQERIFHSLDDEDRRFLTAIILLDSPMIETLYEFFADELSYLEFHSRLLNMEERLLIYQRKVDGRPRLHITPFFADRMRRKVTDPAILFPGELAADEATPDKPWLDVTLLLAFYSFLDARDTVFKTDGSLKKSAERSLKQTVPLLGSGNGRIRIVLHALKNLRLLVQTPDGFDIDDERWDRFGALNDDSRRYLLWSGAFSYQAVPHARTLEKNAAFMRSLLRSLQPGVRYLPEVIYRIAAILPGSHSRRPPIDPESLVSTLSRLQVLTEKDGKLMVNPRTMIDSTDSVGDGPSLIVEANFDVTVTKKATFEEMLLVSRFAEIRRFDTALIFELTKRSVIRGLDREIGTARIRDFLIERSGHPLPQNVLFSLESWQQEYRSIELLKGVVMVVDEERRYLFDHTPEMKRWIRRTLAPGVFLLDERERRFWEPVLKKSGIDPVPDLRIPTSHHDRQELEILPPQEEFSDMALDAYSPMCMEFSASHAQADRSQTEEIRHEPEHTDPSRHFEECYTRLDELELPRDIHEQIAARIENRVIIHPSQVHPEAVRQEKTEAKGLDYLGKVRLIEQALTSDSELLEIIERSSDGSPQRLLLKPTELRKNGNDLILHGLQLPEESEISARVRKIGLLRKIKGSLFSP